MRKNKDLFFDNSHTRAILDLADNGRFDEPENRGRAAEFVLIFTEALA